MITAMTTAILVSAGGGAGRGGAGRVGAGEWGEEVGVGGGVGQGRGRGGVCGVQGARAGAGGWLLLVKKESRDGRESRQRERVPVYGPVHGASAGNGPHHVVHAHVT